MPAGSAILATLFALMLSFCLPANLSAGISSVSGIPETFDKRTTGTMVSPGPPNTTAVTFSTETSSSCAMKVRKRAESSTPAIPMMRCLGNFDALNALQHIASRGFVTRIMMALGDYFAICSDTLVTTA